MVCETRNPAIDGVAWQVLDGDELDRTDGITLIVQSVEPLTAGSDHAHSVRSDETVDVYPIVSTKVSDCAEDCGFCAQSAHFDTGIETHGLSGTETVLDTARRVERDGV